MTVKRESFSLFTYNQEVFVMTSSDHCPIPTEQVLIQKSASLNLSLIKVYPVKSLDLILDFSLDSFLSFVSNQHLIPFYFYEYLDDSDLLITGEFFDEPTPPIDTLIHAFNFNSDFSTYINELAYPDEYDDEDKFTEEDLNAIFSSFELDLAKEIAEYNQSVNKQILQYPSSLHLFTLLEGKAIGIVYRASDDYHHTAKLKLLSILESHEDVLAQRKAFSDEYRSKLRDFLLHDSDFQLCTNQKLRKNYAQHLWNNPAYPDIKNVFYGFGIHFYPEYPTPDFESFIELTYKEYKASKYLYR